MVSGPNSGNLTVHEVALLLRFAHGGEKIKVWVCAKAPGGEGR